MNLKILFSVNALVFALPAFAHEAENGPHGGRVTRQVFITSNCRKERPN